MQAEGGATAILRIYALSPDGSASFRELQQPPSSSGPVRRRDIFTIPADSAAFAILVFCMVEGTSGAAFFDEISLTQGVPSTWNEAIGRQDAGAPLTATVNVDAGLTMRQIPTTLFGSNLEWIWDGNGVWDPARNALNTSIVNLTRAAGVTQLRFPGAAFADYYDWRKGVGPRGSRPATDARPTGPTSLNRFGTDEALSFASQTNSKLLITVNVYTSTAEEAAAWVEYVNGAGRRVDYWEVGNENYVPGPGSLTPEEYAARFLQFARAMRAVDPGIKVGAIGDENFSLIAPRQYPDWTERVVRIAGHEIDFLSVHCAYAPALYSDMGWNSRTVYSSLLAAPTLIARQLNSLAKRLDALTPGRATPIRIAVTEWGPYFQTDPSGRFVDHPKTLASALFAASTLKTFIESPRTDVANMFKLVDASYLGWIGLRNGVYTAKASLMTFQMFRNYFGPTLVSSTTDSPTYDSPSVGWVDAAGPVPFLDVITSKSSDSKTLYVMGINKHFDRDIQARIHILNFASDGRATVYTLNGTAPDANTGTTVQSFPGVTWATQATIGPISRFNNGGPGEVTIANSSLSNLTSDFDFVFRAHSVTSIVLTSR
jgi:alpha-N-arabinofuranosidase